jgi:uncharacterized membrane protein
MSKFVVVIFPSEPKAYDGTRALKELQGEGSIALFGLAVITKDSDGKVSLKTAADRGPLGTGVGALTGGLIGLLGGPVTGAMGLAAGGVLGSLGDLFNLGVRTDFVDNISQKLTPGKAAVIAEVNEDWVTPIDTRMAAIGGTVLRHWRADFEDEQIEKEIDSAKADIAQLQAEYAQARDETKAKLKARIDESRGKLKATSDRARARIENLQQETNAKIKSLQEQAARTTAESKSRINARIIDLREDSQRRSAKLEQAWSLTKEALNPAA